MVSHNLYLQITDLENIFLSYKEFRRGKRKKEDVQEFERNKEDNLFTLYWQLRNKTYRHSDYTSFLIHDPKLRRISKACVCDRIVHRLVYKLLDDLFDKNFIYDSYSCRIDKGTHAASRRLSLFSRKVSQNYTSLCFGLKCDIKKFFDSVNHQILFDLIQKKIKNKNILRLIQEIIASFSFEREHGLPIGNLTSQIFANIYLHELDQFIKHQLKIKYYLRYCDDFVILDINQENLLGFLHKISDFLEKELKLSLHQRKIEIRKLRQGIDFCGYIVLPGHRILRVKTKRRMMRKLCENNLSSYQGLLNHCDSFKLKQETSKIIKDF